MQKIMQLGSLLETQHKEKMIRQIFNFEPVLQIAQSLALEEKIFQANEVVKSFSSLEVKDIHHLFAVKSSDLIFKDNITLKPSKLFEDLRNARKTIVNTYLSEAVDHAYDLRTYNIKNKLVIYLKYYIRLQNIESNLTLWSLFDYISVKR
ncbi:37611_t:CDS:2, partial [Gigaspora margarita]